MTDEQIALARRLVACEQWRWVQGMSTHDINPHGGEPCGGWVIEVGIEGTENPDTTEWGPDLDDYATASILLRMAMEAIGGSVTGAHPLSGAWHFGNEAYGGWERDLGTAAARALLATWESETAQQPERVAQEDDAGE